MMNDSNNQYELPPAQTLTNDELTVHIPGVAEQVQRQSVKESVRLGLWTSVAAVLVLIFIFLIGFVFVKSQKDSTENSGFKKVPLSQSAFSAVSADQLNLGQLGQVDINGLLRVNGGLVITPTTAPSTPLTGQLYFNKDTNQMSYYDGTAFQIVANQSSTVSTVGGASGAIGLGNGLALQGNTLSATAINNAVNAAAVTSVQGQTGSVLFLAGDGIGLSGTTISNTGVRSVGGASGNLAIGRGLAQAGNSLSSTVSLTSGSISLIVTEDGNGNYTISQSGIGTGGTVALGPAITQTDSSNFPSIRIDKTGTGNLLHLSDNGTDRFIVTQAGAISVGTIGFRQLTGVPSIVNSVTDGVTTSSGGLTIGSGLGLSGSTISNTGVRSLAGTANQVAVSGATGVVTLSLPQDINTNSTPTFSGLTLTSLGNGLVQSASGVISSGAVDRNSATLFTNNLSVTNGGTGATNAIGARSNLGAAASGANGDITSLSGLTTALSVPQGGTGTNNLSTNGVLIGNGGGAISSVVAGGTGLCLTSTAGAPSWAACPGSGGVSSVNTFTGAVAIQGTADQVNVSSGAGTITLSLPQNLNTTSSPQFSSLTLSGGLTVSGGTGTFGTATQAGGVIIYDGSTNTATFQTASLGQNTVYTLPDPGLASTTICLTSGNCAGVGGGVTTAGGTTNTLAKFSGTSSIANSNITDNGTTVSIGSALNVTGAVTLTTALSVGNGGTGATSAINARTNLGAAASGANSDITSLSGLTTALSVGQGGTGATTLGSNGVIVGNGTGALSSIVAGGTGLCLMSTAGAPSWGACPGGAGGVDDVNGFTGSITIQGTANQVSVASGSGTLTLSLPQNIHTGSSPQFTGLTLSGLSNGLVQSSGGVISSGAADRNSGTLFTNNLSVTNGGTGAANAIGARSNLGAAASGANGDITSLTGLTTALSVGQGGTGATTLGSNGVLIGNGTGAISSVVAGGTGLCLTSTAGAPSWASCPGSGGVSTVNTFSGAVTVQGTANQVNVNNSAGTITLSLPQNLNTTSSPQFSSLTLTGNLAVQGGTGTFGTTTVAGGVVIYDGSSNTGTLQTAALGQNTVYTLPDPGLASATICLSTGNCAGSGGGVTTAGGTTNYLALFSGTSSIGNSTVSQSGSTLTATGNLVLQGANSLAVGTASTNAGSIAFYNTAGANTVSIQAPNANPGSNLVLRLPSSDGGNGDCLKTDSAGNLSFGTCLSGSGGGGSGVISLDGLSGTLTISNATGSGSNITIDDATTTARGIASFNASNFSVASGAVTIATGGITSTEISNGTITGTDIGATTVANSNLVNSSLTVTAGNGLSGGGSVALGASTSLAVAYGSAANTAVQGNTSLVCASGTGNLSGGGNSITLGSGGTCGSLSTVNNPTFTTSVTTAQLIMTGAGSNGTLQVANLGQATAYTLPDPGGATASICLSTGNCAGSGGGVTTAGGTNNTIAKFTGTQTLGNSTITDNGSTVAIGGALNVTGAVGLTVQLSVANGGTGATTLGSNGVLLGNGTSAISSLVAGSAGLCLTSTAGAPTWASCPGSGGVSTVNTFSGAVTVQGTSNQISVNNSAGTITLSTPQNIHTGASPQFSGLTLSSDLAVNGSAITTTSTGTVALFNTNAVGLNIGGAVNATGINLAGGSASTGCTIDGSNGNLTCSGNITGGATGTSGYFTRSGTTLSPATSGDNITTSGNLSTTGSGTITSAGTLTASGGASISSGLNNNNGGITNTGSIAGASTIAASGNINTTGGVLQTNSLTRIDNSGNLTNIGNLTATGAIQISSTSATNDITLTSADQIILNSVGTIELQDNTNLTGNFDVSGTLFAGTADAFQVASNGAVTAVGVNFGSGLLQGSGGLTVSGTIALNGNTDINNNVSFATRAGSTFTTPGTSTSAALNGASYYLLDTSGAAQVIQGITAGRDGQRVTLTNVDASNAVTFANDNAGATGARVITGTGNDITLAIGATIELIYDLANTRWRVQGGVAGGNGTCSTCANTSLSNLSGVNINTALNRNGGDLTLQTTTSGNIIINAAGTLDVQDTIANSTGNLVLNDTVDIGSASTGLRVSTDGVVTDLDDSAVTIGQTLAVSGDINITGGNLTSTAGTLTIDGGGTVSITDNLTMTGILFQSSNGIRVATFDNISTRIDSGFYETDTATPAEGWPSGCGSNCHLIASTHSNTGNYYSLQLAGDFFNQNFYLRSTNGSGTQTWSQVATLENTQTFSGTKSFSAVTTFNENVNLGAADQIDFADESADKIYLNSNTQGIGVEANTLTNWTDTQFRWRTGATSSTTGTERMLLDASNLNLTNGTGLAVAGNTTLSGTLAVNGGQITSSANPLIINANGGVDIQDPLTADSLTLDSGDITVAGGDFATSAITLNKPIYIRGTGNNNPGNRLVRIGSDTHVNNASRGLTLTIITATTHVHVSSTNYDTYGTPADSDNLATALNNLTRNQIGILTSVDAFENSITTNLRTAAFRLGLDKLGTISTTSSLRAPYAAIFRGAGTGTNNSEAGRQSYELLQNQDADSPTAIITTWLTEDGFMGQSQLSALYSSNSQLSIPSLQVDYNGRVGIGTTSPSALLHVSNASGPLFVVTDTTATSRDVLTIADGGATTFRNQTNSTAAFQIQNAAGTSNLFVADTTNSRIGINQTPTAGGAALQVSGDINASGVLYSGGGTYFLGSGGNFNSMNINDDGVGTVRVRSNTNVATAFQIQNATGADTLLTADTTARSGSGGNLIKIGNSTGTDTATTILQLDGSTTVPTSNLAALNGGMFYNSTTGRINIIEGGAVKVVCNHTDALCGGNSTTLQQAYDNSASPTVVTTSSAAKTITFRSGATFDAAGMFNIQNAASVNVLSVDTSAGRVSFGDNGTDTGQIYSGGRVPTTTTGIATAQNAIGDVSIQGKYAYSVSYDNNVFRVFDISNPSAPTNIANSGAILSNADDVIVSGRYAYTANIGDDTLKVSDISNPNNITNVASVSLGSGADPARLVIGGNYIYILNNGTAEIEVWDISSPTAPQFVSTVSSSLVNPDPQDAYLQGRYLYVVNNVAPAVLEVFDISNPYAITSAGSVATTHAVVSVVVSGRYAYLGDEQPTSTLKIFDVENPASMSQIGTVATAAGNGLRSLRISGQYVYGVTTFTSNRLHIFDVSTPTAPSVVGSVVLSGTEAYDLEIQGRYAYIPTYIGDTFEVYDLGGAYLQQLQAGNVEVSTLAAQDLFVDNNTRVGGALNVGGDAMIASDLGVGGNSYFMGDIKVGKRADSTTAIARATNSTAGRITAAGSQIAVDGVMSSVVYNGSLYVGTQENDAAEVYRYDGNNIWTQIHTTDGNICGQTGVDAITTMVVHGGYMYVGTSTTVTATGQAEICRYDGGTTWTRVSTATPGTIATLGRTAIDQVFKSTVVNGQLYFGTYENDVAQIYRYNGSAGDFTVVHAADGTICGQANVDGITSMVSYDSQLYVGTQEVGAAEICRYDGGTTWTRVSSATAGTVVPTQRAGIDGIWSLAVYNGSMYAATNEANNAEIYRYDGGTTGNFAQIHAVDGAICGATGVDTIRAMTVYNGHLYIGTETTVTATGQAELCRYDGSDVLTRINSASGTFVSTAIDSVTSLAVWNGQLFTSIFETNLAEVYSYAAVEGQSFALRFGAASDNDGAELQSFYNEGSISFAAEQQSGASPGMGSNGSFLFSHGITTAFGAYDIAEDYPTRDEDILPGSLVSIDPNETGFVRRTQTSNDSTILGVFSEKPGLRLSQAETHINGARPIPIALAGRVPVNVTDENGPILPGDYLTSSSTPGYAMKAIQPGPTVGKSLEAFNGQGTGKVLTFINISYYEPSVSGMLQVNSAEIGTLNVQGGVMVTGNINTTGDISLGGNLAVAGDATIGGNLTVAGTLTTGRLVVNGHISTGGEVPTVSVLPSAGNNATITIDGNDSAGALTLTTGSQSLQPGDLVKVLFFEKYDRDPRVVITPVGRESAMLGGYVSQTTEEFVLGATTQPEPNKTYKFNYFIVE